MSTTRRWQDRGNPSRCRGMARLPNNHYRKPQTVVNIKFERLAFWFATRFFMLVLLGNTGKEYNIEY